MPAGLGGRYSGRIDDSLVGRAVKRRRQRYPAQMNI
jgi:hypothetical protein